MEKIINGLKRKKRTVFAVKVVIGFALIFWIFRNIDVKKVFEYFQGLEIKTVIPVLLLSWAGLLIQFIRWRNLVVSNSADFQKKDLPASFFAGFAFRLMLPGGHAEIGKVFMLQGKKTGKMFAYGMDKIYQTFIKLFVMAAVVPFVFPRYTYLSVLFIIGLTAGLLLIPKIRALKVHQEKDVPNKRLFVQTCVFSLLILLVMILQYYLLLRRVSAVSLLQTGNAIIFLWGSGVVAISISGLGVREWVAYHFLPLFGIVPAYAVSTSLFVFFVNCILPAAVGAVFIYRHRLKLLDVKDTIMNTGDLLSGFKKKGEQDIVQ